jgi:hypothetical protein
MVTQATKTIDDLYAEVRAQLNDSQEPYRTTDAVLFSIINTALREVYRYRPDAYIGNFTSGVLSNNLVNSYSAADLGQNPLTPFPLDDRIFYGPILFYVVGRADLTDDEFADNNRAMTLLGAFRNMLVGSGG